MSIIVVGSYKKQYLNNFFILLNKEISLFNNALSRYLYYSFMLYRMRIFYFYMLILKKYNNVLNVRMCFVFLLFVLQNSFSFFHLRYCNFVYDFFVMFRSFSLSFLNIFLCLKNLSYIYLYILFLFFYWKNNGFSLPMKKHYEVVLRSPHGHKKAKERFVKKVYYRGLQYPLFYVTTTNLLFTKLFNFKKGLSISHKYSINID